MKSKESEYHEKKPKQSEKEVSQEVQSDGEISYDTNTNFSKLVKKFKSKCIRAEKAESPPN